LICNLDDSSVEVLTEWYVDAAATHRRATAAGDHHAANVAHDALAVIHRGLRARGLIGERALLFLLHHADDAVRCWAASHALEFAPEKAEATLTRLAAAKGPVAFTAKMVLREWRAGNLSFPS
jgi:hypothetical protein